MLLNNSKIVTFTGVKIDDMTEKFKKLLHLIVMIVAAIALIVFAIIHFMTALNTQYGMLVMIAYVIMFIWAVCRVIVLAKEYHRL